MFGLRVTLIKDLRYEILFFISIIFSAQVRFLWILYCATTWNLASSNSLEEISSLPYYCIPPNSSIDHWGTLSPLFFESRIQTHIPFTCLLFLSSAFWFMQIHADVTEKSTCVILVKLQQHISDVIENNYISEKHFRGYGSKLLCIKIN